MKLSTIKRQKFNKKIATENSINKARGTPRFFSFFLAQLFLCDLYDLTVGSD